MIEATAVDRSGPPEGDGRHTDGKNRQDHEGQPRVAGKTCLVVDTALLPPAPTLGGVIATGLYGGCRVNGRKVVSHANTSSTRCSGSPDSGYDIS